MTPIINVGIVGGGLSAQVFHAPFITANTRLNLKSFLRTRDEPVLHYEAIPVSTDAKAFFASQDIELVIITSPTSLHYEQCKQALEAGKHVIVEKPFTVHSAEAVELIALAREKGKILAVYQNRRWDGDFLTVKKLIEEEEDGNLGRVVEFDSRFERYRNTVREGSWKEKDIPGSGIIYDLGAHLIDQALTLFGPPNSITAHVLNLRQLSAVTDDAFTINLLYTDPHPRLVTLKSTMLATHPSPRYTIHFVRGTFVKSGVDVQEEQLRARKTPDSPDYGVEATEHSGRLHVAEGVEGRRSGPVITERGDYMAFFDNVADAILGKGPDSLMVKPEQAADVIRVIELAKLSSKVGRAVPFGYLDGDTL
ncbi:hypothetical protein HKX48_007802 [Thoreauomyces humboldtii]|nr:hypothetical protein HKX48_007802 [Thoreauomyces humboldtii]